MRRRRLRRYRFRLIHRTRRRGRSVAEIAKKLRRHGRKKAKKLK